MSASYEAAVLGHWGGQSDGAHDLGHLRRVWTNCRRIAADEPADLEVLEAAAFFHDLVNLPRTSPDRARASVLSAEAAIRWLRAQDFAEGKLEAVYHAIAAHSFSAGIAPVTAEARILQDADRLDALGAIGIARMFHVAGAMGALLFDADDPLATGRALDDRRFSLDHLQTKLLTLAATMQTAAGRRMAVERSQWMLGFRDRLLAEIQ
ncbi:HD domain-containing protein [bacterium]|nr:HD domain-containing protein [bacterium]